MADEKPRRGAKKIHLPFRRTFRYGDKERVALETLGSEWQLSDTSAILRKLLNQARVFLAWHKKRRAELVVDYR